MNRREETLADLGLIIHEATDALYAFAVYTEGTEGGEALKMGLEAVKAVRELAENILKGEGPERGE